MKAHQMTVNVNNHMKNVIILILLSIISQYNTNVNVCQKNAGGENIERALHDTGSGSGARYKAAYCKGMAEERDDKSPPYSRKRKGDNPYTRKRNKGSRNQASVILKKKRGSKCEQEKTD